MKTKAEKALDACKEYDRLMTEIRRNTDEIGSGADSCSSWVCDRYGIKSIPGNGMTHLTESFEPHEDEGECFTTKVFNDETEIIEIIGECQGCLRAYKAVQERKANKKKLGTIKRTIRAIARAA